MSLTASIGAFSIPKRALGAEEEQQASAQDPWRRTTGLSAQHESMDGRLVSFTSISLSPRQQESEQPIFREDFSGEVVSEQQPGRSEGEIACLSGSVEAQQESAQVLRGDFAGEIVSEQQPGLSDWEAGCFLGSAEAQQEPTQLFLRDFPREIVSEQLPRLSGWETACLLGFATEQHEREHSVSPFFGPALAACLSVQQSPPDAVWVPECRISASAQQLFPSLLFGGDPLPLPSEQHAVGPLPLSDGARVGFSLEQQEPPQASSTVDSLAD